MMLRAPAAALAAAVVSMPALAGVTAPPPVLNAPAFYKKYVDADGIPVLSSEKVPDEALYRARDIVRTMLRERADVRARIIQNGGRVAIMAETEVTTDIPEHSQLYTQFPGVDWNTRARGLGGTLFIPMTTCAEENLLAYASDRYKGENILVHEFAHGIYNLGIVPLDGTFAPRLQSAYTTALAGGKYANTYADDNTAEYWAEGAQSWFDTNLQAIPANGIHNEINTRAEITAYDPPLAALLDEIFPAGYSIPWSPSGTDADGDAIPDAVEGPEDTNRFVKDNDVFAATPKGARLFAMQQYRDFLAREGDEAGIGGWASAIAAGTYSRAAVVNAFFNSVEFNGFVAPVVRLYYATYLRVPDYAGLVHNAGLVRNGALTLTQLADFFTTSPEFQSLYGALDNAQFVTLLYNNVLGRAPDSGGLAGWVNLLNTGYTRGQVLLGFSESTEYQIAKFNEVYVTMMYVGMLRRSPEPGGYNGWLSYLQGGNTPLNMISGFYNATEYRGRFLP